MIFLNFLSGWYVPIFTSDLVYLDTVILYFSYFVQGLFILSIFSSNQFLVLLTLCTVLSFFFRLIWLLPRFWLFPAILPSSVCLHFLRVFTCTFQLLVRELYNFFMEAFNDISFLFALLSLLRINLGMFCLHFDWNLESLYFFSLFLISLLSDLEITE